MKRGRWLGVAGAAVAGATALTVGLAGLASAGPVATNRQPGPAVGANEGASAATATSTTLSHLTLTASAFGPDGSHTGGKPWFNLWDPSTLSNTTSGRCFESGVTLPATALIKSVTFYYTHGDGSFVGQLNKQLLATHASVILALVHVTSTTATPVYTKVTVNATTGKVFASDGYALGVCFTGTTTFSGATVNYSG